MELVAVTEISPAGVKSVGLGPVVWALVYYECGDVDICSSWHCVSLQLNIFLTVANYSAHTQTHNSTIYVDSDLNTPYNPFPKSHVYWCVLCQQYKLLNKKIVILYQNI